MKAILIVEFDYQGKKESFESSSFTWPYDTVPEKGDQLKLIEFHKQFDFKNDNQLKEIAKNKVFRYRRAVFGWDKGAVIEMYFEG